MTNSKATIIGVMGLVLLLATANAQEPRPEAKKGDAAAILESAYQGELPPEAVRMLAAVLRGSRMGPGEGWFGPAEIRYSWKWLAGRCGIDAAKGRIPRERVRGSDAWFARLDRNKDGVLAPDDFDWSERSSYVQKSRLLKEVFGKLDANGNGWLTKPELEKFIDKAGKGKPWVTADDFRDALLGGSSARARPSDMPSQAVLIRGLFAGELGSMNEGPKLNQPAPDFTLKTFDDKETIQLAKRIGPKPIVLVFGSFT